MGFVMNGLGAESYDRNYHDAHLFFRIIDHLRPVRRKIILTILIITLSSLIDTAQPVLLAIGVDLLFRMNQWPLLISLSIIVLAVGFVSWWLNFLRQQYTAQIVSSSVAQLRTEAFAAAVSNDLSFHDEHQSGTVVSRIVSDSENFSTVITLFLNLLSQIILLLFLVILLLRINPGLAAVTVSVGPIIVCVALIFRSFARRILQLGLRANSRVSGAVQEAISGISIARNFRQEQTLYNSFRSLSYQSYRVNLKTGLFFGSLFPILIGITNLAGILVIYVGAISVARGEITPGTLFLFVQAVGIYWMPLTSISSFWSQFQQGLAAGERIFALVDAGRSICQNDDQPVTELRGAVEIRNVSFSYRPGYQVLSHFNFSINPGELVALVGPTGAGKSTVARLIARLYEFQDGEILIDGRDIRSLNLRQYRSHLGIVPQTHLLFSGTVRENIRYGLLRASDAEIAAAARSIGRGEWLQSLPDGLDTVIGEGGRSLSMGQRQLISLSRIVLQRPQLVILDEATASVDPITEAQIHDGLNLLMHGRTALVIAHRLSTVEHADRIVVMKGGCIVEWGNHDQLLQAGGHYAELFEAYFRYQSPDYESR